MMAGTTAPQTSIDYRQMVRRVLWATLLGAAVFAGLSFYSDVRQLADNFRAFSYDAFALALILAASNYAIRIVRWRYYLRLVGAAIPGVEASLVFLAGFVLSITPGKLGEALKSLMLYESRGISIAKTVPVVIAERLTDLTGLVLLIAIGSFSFEHGVIIAALSAALVGIILAACAYKPLGELLLVLVERIPLTKRIAYKIREAYESLHEMTRPAPLFFGTAIGATAWGFECGALYVILRGLGCDVLSWDAITFTYSTSTIAGALAMMPGGLGVTEAGMTGLLLALGRGRISPASAAAATILVRLATLWFAVGIGFIALALRRFVTPKR